MLTTISLVALGGAIGASLRFLTGVLIMRGLGNGGFPIPVLLINILGSFLMGLFVVWSSQRGMNQWNPFVTTGVLGGFTTFSAFSLEAVTLFERGDTAQALVYVGLSIVGSIAALAAGMMMMRVIS